MDDRYWNAELEIKPWADVLKWQGAKRQPFLSALPGRSRFYSRKLAGLPLGALAASSLAALAELPFTGKDDLRVAQSAPAPGEPFGEIQAVPLAEIVQVLSNWSDAIANVFYTAGVRRAIRFGWG